MDYDNSVIQERMRGEYRSASNNLTEQDILQIPSFTLLPTFKNKLKRAAEEGLLLFAKYALVIILAYLALLFATNVVSGSTNGTQSALYLQELQNKGYLPKIINGTVPPKTETVDGEKNATPNK